MLCQASATLLLQDLCLTQTHLTMGHPSLWAKSAAPKSHLSLGSHHRLKKECAEATFKGQKTQSHRCAR